MSDYIKLHKFFIKESYSFMKGTNRVKYYLYYPIAYLRFIYFSLKN